MRLLVSIRKCGYVVGQGMQGIDASLVRLRVTGRTRHRVEEVDDGGDRGCGGAEEGRLRGASRGWDTHQAEGLVPEGSQQQAGRRRWSESKGCALLVFLAVACRRRGTIREVRYVDGGGASSNREYSSDCSQDSRDV